MSDKKSGKYYCRCRYTCNITWNIRNFSYSNLKLLPTLIFWPCSFRRFLWTFSNRVIPLHSCLLAGVLRSLGHRWVTMSNYPESLFNAGLVFLIQMTSFTFLDQKYGSKSIMCASSHPILWPVAISCSATADRPGLLSLKALFVISICPLVIYLFL